MTSTASITLRHAGSSDATALARLAALDSQVLPAGPFLIAESGDDLVAAVSERDGHAIADPFQPTASAVTLLRSWQDQRTRRPKAARRLHLRVALAR